MNTSTRLLFPPTSRYHNLETARYETASGKENKHNVFFDSFNKFDEIFVSSQTIHSSFPVSTESVKTL